MNRSGLTLIFCTLIGAYGCGHNSNVSSVKGTVTQEGKPLAGVRIAFLPDFETNTSAMLSYGITDDSGHYELRSDGGNLGAIKGKYRVCIHDLEYDAQKRLDSILKKGAHKNQRNGSAIEGYSTIPDSEMKSFRVPLEYREFKETPLRAEVLSGPQTFDFEVPYPKKGSQ